MPEIINNSLNHFCTPMPEIINDSLNHFCTPMPEIINKSDNSDKPNKKKNEGSPVKFSKMIALNIQ